MFQRPLDVRGLLSLVAAAEKQYKFPADHRVIHSIARSPINPWFVQSLAHRLAVAKVPGSKPVDSGCYLRLCAGIRQLRQPIVEDILSGAADVVTDFDHW